MSTQAMFLANLHLLQVIAKLSISMSALGEILTLCMSPVATINMKMDGLLQTIMMTLSQNILAAILLMLLLQAQ